MSNFAQTPLVNMRPYGTMANAFKLKSRMPPSWECTMNIFYIIGVVVVVILVAGYLGVHL
jgi:hypothetical protein